MINTNALIFSFLDTLLDPTSASASTNEGMFSDMNVFAIIMTGFIIIILMNLYFKRNG